MSIAERSIDSLGALLDLVTPEAPDPASGRHRSAGVYRGSGCATWPLLTSLDRLGGVDAPHGKAHLEPHVLRSFVRYSRPHLRHDPANDWELLILAQHHGVPTRLLDWSWSPLVAAHFATLAAQPGEPCAVWRLDWHRMHRHFGLEPIALLIADLERLPDAPAEPFTPAALLTRGADRPFACLIEPPALDDRIVAQAATFSLCTETSRSFDAFLESEGLSDALMRFVIPAEAVPRVRDQLDLAGMDERRLFPDFDGVAAYIRRWYA